MRSKANCIQNASIYIHQYSVVLKYTIVVILAISLFCFPTSLISQEQDSVQLTPAFKPNPTKAVIYSAICPGLGQIYNRKYWKLPLVYGSYLGCAYAIAWNSNQYNDYKQAYRDITDDDPDTNSWANFIRSGNNRDPNSWTTEYKNWFESSLKNKRDYYRRYRDLSYIITIGVYALTMVDAYVDAQLFDFDISPNLNVHVEPVIFDKSVTGSRSVGLQCYFKF